MTGSPKAPIPPPPSPALRVPRGEVAGKIQTQINEGGALLTSQVGSEDELDALIAKQQIWFDYSKDLLCQLFSSPAIAEEYSAAVYRTTYVSPGFERIVKSFREYVQTYVTRLRSIQRRLELFEVMDERAVTTPSMCAPHLGTETVNMRKKLFVSHASNDKVIIDSLVDDILHGALAIRLSEIFCTTTDGTKIKSGDDWRTSIQKAIEGSQIVLLIITPNYKESEICMCEMGAAWMSSAQVIPLIVEPITYETVGVLQQPKQVEKLLDEKSLDRLRDVVQEVLRIDPKEIKSDRWTGKKRDFLTKANAHIKAKPYRPPLGRLEYETAIRDKNDLQAAVESLKQENRKLDAILAEVKQAKDRTVVAEIEERHKEHDEMGRFKELCANVSEKLSAFRPIIRGILFGAVSGKELSINRLAYDEELTAAISQDYITERLDPDWETTKVMRELRKAVDELSSFIDEDAGSEFPSAYEEQFTAPLSIGNIDFWREAFKRSVLIS